MAPESLSYDPPIPRMAPNRPCPERAGIAHARDHERNPTLPMGRSR